jgi:hypothetical protein
MSEDIVKRLREYAEEWQIDRSVVDSAADEIIRLRALVEASVVLAQPGALTVNCVRGSIPCQEAERLRARVGDLTDALIDARCNGLIYWSPMTERGAVERAKMMARIDKVLNKEAKL